MISDVLCVTVGHVGKNAGLTKSSTITHASDILTDWLLMRERSPGRHGEVTNSPRTVGVTDPNKLFNRRKSEIHSYTPC